MAFQFQCPQGHLLEGDESQAGQQCQCPMCGMLFIIPQPIGAPAAAYEQQPGGYNPADRFAGLAGQPAGNPAAPFVPGQAAGDPNARFAPGGGPPSAVANPMAAPAAPADPGVLHIPCPNGHELETPEEMLEQEVLCPECNAQFRLRRKDSLEFKRKQEQKEQADRIRLEKTGNLWLMWAIVAVVLVGIILIGLVVFSQMNK